MPTSLRAVVALPEGLVGRRIATVATAVYAASGHRAGSVGEPDLRCRDWIAPDDSRTHLGSARWIAREVAAERVVLRANTLAGLQAAAAVGIGLAPLPCFLADPDPRLVRVLPPVPEMEAGLWLLTYPDLRRTARVRVVLDALAGHLTASRRSFAGNAGRSAGSSGRARLAGPASLVGLEVQIGRVEAGEGDAGRLSASD